MEDAMLAGYLCLFEVSRDMLSVDILIIIQEVDHEVVMLKGKKNLIHDIKTTLNVYV